MKTKSYPQPHSFAIIFAATHARAGTAPLTANVAPSAC